MSATATSMSLPSLTTATRLSIAPIKKGDQPTMKGDQPNQLDDSMVPRTNKLTVYLVIHTLSQLHTDTQHLSVKNVYMSYC